MKHDPEESREMPVNFQAADMKNILISLLVLALMVWLLKTSYNGVVPNVTKQGSLKLSPINWTQALSLMVLSGMLCCARM